MYYHQIMFSKFHKRALEDDLTEPIVTLIFHRLPWLLVGIVGGVVATILSSRFESLLSQNISLVFFIPVIVYMADAVGTQTETIYIRNLAREKVNHSIYLMKELLLGVSLGLIFGLSITVFALWWFRSFEVATTVGLAMFANIALAPLVALMVARFLQKEHTDPALGAGPFTTVIQDIMSLGIYFAVASFIIFR